MQLLIDIFLEGVPETILLSLYSYFSRTESATAQKVAHLATLLTKMHHSSPITDAPHQNDETD